MAHYYLATATKPSAVTASAVGNFIHEDKLCLLVCKLNHFEVFSLGPEGLKSVIDVPLFGHIATFHLFRPKVQTSYIMSNT